MTTAIQQASFDDLASMIAYMEAQCQKINALVGEIEEIQRAFETGLVDSEQQFENARTQAAVWVEERNWTQPAWVAERVANQLPQVRQAKQKRLRELEEELADLHQQREAMEAQSQARMAALKDNNPKLNLREEQLKQQEEDLQAALEARMVEWRQAARGLGWLLQPGKVKRLRNQAEATAEQLTNVNARLTEVRNSWQKMEDNAEQNESHLQEAWRLRTAEIARLKREQNELQNDLEDACRRAALDEILDSVAQPQPSDQPEFDAMVERIIRLHDEVTDYRNGIAQVAELMGIMKGVCEGIQRMEESVKSVKQEQDMHAELRDLKLQAPPVALQFHQLWDQLHPVVLDEKVAAEKPRDLAQRLRATVGERLSNAALDAMFNALGNELDRATKEQW